MTKFFRYFFIALLCGSSFSVIAQQITIVKYYDSSWLAISKDSAFYFTNFVKKGNSYQCTSYWMKSKKLNCVSFSSDTLFSKITGLLSRYYENGQIQDSSFYGAGSGAMINSYRYYENGKLRAHYSLNEVDKKETQEGYDENGKRIRNFIFGREANFEGGFRVWVRYLEKKLKSETAEKNGAPGGTYQVMVRFTVTKDGMLTGVMAETKWGFGMEEEAIRVIKNSPNWIPAIVMNEAENAYRRQPITFVVQGK